MRHDGGGDIVERSEVDVAMLRRALGLMLMLVEMHQCTFLDSVTTAFLLRC